MKTYFGNHVGIVIDNNDPEHRGRVQVFVPHIMPTLYEDWNKKGEDIRIKCVADNVPEGLTSEIVEKLKKILPWAEAASPIIGQSSPGGVSPGLAGALASAGISVAGAIGGDPASQGAPGAGGGVAQPNEAASIGNNLDQSPTAAPAGALTPGEPFLMPKQAGVDVKGLRPIFLQRLNAFYKEAVSLGYTFECTSGFRSYEKQNSLYLADLEKQKKKGIFDAAGNPKPSGFVAPPGNSTHETGIAIDVKVKGPGVYIWEISGAAELAGRNYDTEAYRSLLRKYNLHQPLHPQVYGASKPERWHIEPIEMPGAFRGDRSGPVSVRVAQQLSIPNNNAVAENASSSQFPAGSNPLVTNKPQDMGTSSSPPRTT